MYFRFEYVCANNDPNFFFFIFNVIIFKSTEWSVDNRKILWQHEEMRENTLPEFDGVPYILNGTKVLECQYGVNRSAYHKKQHLDRKKVRFL